MVWNGYLTLDGTEIVNVSRTEAYATQAGASWFKPVYRNEALRPLLGQDDYVSPDVDLAPWYDEDVEESVDFWGAYPLDVQGMDNSARSSSVIEFTTDGGSPGRIRHATKTGVYSMALVGASERAVEYGLRWLRRALLGAVCSTNLADTTTLGATLGCLSVAPVLPEMISGDNPVDGDTVFLYGGDAGGIPPDTPATIDAALRVYQRFFRNAKVISGPSIDRKIDLSRSSCKGAAWLVQFTVVAGDPFEYGANQTVLQGYMDPSITDPWSPDLREVGVADTAWATFADVDCGVDIWQPIYDPTCAALVAPPTPPTIPLGCYSPPSSWNRRKVSIPAENIPTWGDLLPVLTVYSLDGLRNLRVRWYANADGDFDPNDNPCDFLGDWVISYIPAGGTMVVDSVARQSRVTTALGHVRRADSLVFQNDSTPIVWPRLTCGYGYIMTLDLPATEATPVVDLSLVPRMAD